MATATLGCSANRLPPGGGKCSAYRKGNFPSFDMCGILESYTLGVVRSGGDPPGHVHTGICRRIGNGLVPANFDTVPSCKAVVFYPSHVIWARNGADLGHHSYCLLLMLMLLLLLLLMHHHPFRHLLRKKKNIVSFLASARK